ncbi:ATP-binding protein [Denitromonas iodatirespirans]|uniref:ATP-binding protein n=1 Tax=Denitromonas iodatirespirans TaxID=2795389 RepID=A0A944H9M1_DENI1|nr:AAA family ATPase [Denitromonas iodatirespirans]MBT0962575.1 ATP-binding protein [Denitromonas iodatirespirans]
MTDRPIAPVFPFTAVHGQSRLKRSLLLTTIDPLIGGVLVSGPRGTAKSTSARALAELLPGGRFVNLPLGASEEQLVGSLDLEAALQQGRVDFRPGLLARAHAGVLYVDEVNLLADALVDLLLDVCASGINRIERDGISHSHAARIVLVGTMNPEEGELRPQLLDRFGLFVQLDDTPSPAERERIVRTRLAFDADPAGFVAGIAAEQRALAERLAGARARVEAIRFSDADHARVAALCHEADVEGVRADLVMLRAARAHAAFEGRDALSAADIDAVSELVLAHRRRQPAEPPAAGQAPQGAAADTPAAEPPWGELPPQPVPIDAVKTVRPLQAKKF